MTPYKSVVFPIIMGAEDVLTVVENSPERMAVTCLIYLETAIAAGRVTTSKELFEVMYSLMALALRKYVADDNKMELVQDMPEGYEPSKPWIDK